MNMVVLNFVEIDDIDKFLKNLRIIVDIVCP